MPQKRAELTRAEAGFPVTNLITQVDIQQENPGFIGAHLVRGFQSLFPDFNITSVLTVAGASRFNLNAEIQGCNSAFSELLAISDVYQPGWQHEPRVQTYQNITGVGGRDFAGPLLVVQGATDNVVPAQVVDIAVNRTCERFPDKEFEYQSYAGATHVPAMYAAQRNWLQRVEDRFEGRAVEEGRRRKSFRSIAIEQILRPESMRKKVRRQRFDENTTVGPHQMQIRLLGYDYVSIVYGVVM
ncbi:MAG: hypothetical protein Q9181_001366 [Wetmoreana brouardii]